MEPPDNGPRDETVTFAHPSEKEFARLLDFYGIEWLYEPRTFPLAWDEEGRITEGFTPDFYLAAHDLYVELTTLESGLMARKYRKLRRLHELYPEINIKLIDRRDFGGLLWKYGLQDETEGLIGKSAHDQNNDLDGK